jgi:methionyl-tRNA synthetase
MDRHLLHVGGQEAWNLVARTNRFVEESAPWTLYKTGDSERLQAVLASLARAVARITVMASPFLPDKAQQIWEALGQAGRVEEAGWGFIQRPEAGGSRVIKPPPLFPKPESRS